jgi:DNA-binding NarL/FixJ family response regulator
MDADWEVAAGRNDQGDRVVPPLPVAIVAANEHRRDALCALLAGHPSVVIQRAVSEVAALRDDVATGAPGALLLDAGAGSDDTTFNCAQLRRFIPTAGIIIVGIVAPYDGLADLVSAGATAFLTREATASATVATIHRVASGEYFLPAELTSSLFTQLVRERAALSAALEESVVLTSREREITALLGEGLSNKEIAARLRIAIHTVKSHVHNILEKLSLRSRLEVVALARAARGRP